MYVKAAAIDKNLPFIARIDFSGLSHQQGL
jgi:hypothetical protein